MPAIKRTDDYIAPAFVKLSERSSDFNEANDCAVKAVAAVTGRAYSVAHRTLKKLGRANGTATPFALTEEAIKVLGYKLEEFSVREIVDRFPGVHVNLKSFTTHSPARFPEAFVGEPNILAITSGHAAAIVKGATIDYGHNRALRVKRAYRVTPIN